MEDARASNAQRHEPVIPGRSVTWRFDDRVVVVTDAGAEAAATQAAAFAAAGARVYACHRALPAESAACSVAAVAVDFTVESQVADLAAMISGDAGRLDVLVINPPLVEGECPLVDVDDGKWQRLIADGLTGAFLAAKHLAPLMFALRSGAIVLTAGPESCRGAPGRAHVSASHHAIVGLAKDLAIDAAQHQINVNVAAEARSSGDGRSATDVLTHTVLWLASDAARFVTGTVLVAGAP